MNLIPPQLHDTIYYEIETNSYARRDNIPRRGNNSKVQELYEVIEMIIEEELNKKNFKYETTLGFGSYIYFEDDQTCICSQKNCRKMFYIKHGIIFKIGSVCIQKLFPEDTEQNNEIIKNYSKSKCRDCDEVLDKRFKHGKLGYCLDCWMEHEQIKKIKEEENYPFCYCRVKVVKKTVKDVYKKHFGMDFYTCGCKFWKLV
jgi:hypothetical protein